MPEKKLRIALVGWGAINRRVAELLGERRRENVAIVGIGERDAALVTAAPANAQILTAPEQLAGLDLDLVLEAAGRGAVAAWGEWSLRSARMFVVASTSAFCDNALLEKLLRIADEHGSQIVVPPGALAGIDALSAASLLPLAEVTHRIVKPPAAWRNTPAETLTQLDRLDGATTFFSGTAREAAAQFPQNANVAVITALAGVGLDRTRVELSADPEARSNVHLLSASGDFGTFNIRIENRPLATNPKSSEMAALGLVRIIENRVKSLVC